ncbi:MAG: NTP transferase domain-containing protein [Nitrospinae bacterium]|nr:NTP transferase domain-containing protein [Nitrospinota bacterium]
MKEEIRGVIMSAGRGTRMEPFSTFYPKPLLPVCNLPIMEHHINIMKGVGIREVVIVVGHLGFEIAKRMGDGSRFGIKIKYVEQKRNLGIAHAVGMLEPHINGSFLLFLGDIFFISEDFERLIELKRERGSSAVLAVKEENDPEAIKRNFTILLDHDDRVKRVIEKPRYVTNMLKGCGIYLFDLHIFDAIRRTPRTAMRDEYELTEAIQILIEDGFPVDIAKIIKTDINITFPYDLLRCNLEELKVKKKDSLIDENVSLGGAEVINSVIGKNVDIKNPIKISNSLIFPDTTLMVEYDIDSCIATPDDLLDCRRYIRYIVGKGGA